MSLFKLAFGGRLAGEFNREALVKKVLLLLVIAYLLISLVLPLSYVLAKSLQVFEFKLNLIEVEFDYGGGFTPQGTLQDWADKYDYVINDNLKASERSREQAVRIIPKMQRKEVVRLRFKNLSSEEALLAFDGKLIAAKQTITVAKNKLNSVQVLTSKRYSIGNYQYYFNNKQLLNSIWNSLWVALTVTFIVLPLAFAFAYGLKRTQMPFKKSLRTISMIPILAPSLLPAIGLVYLLGKQGVVRELMFGADIYGPVGIIIASVFFILPHAIIIMLVALSSSDQRLYDAAKVLGAGRVRSFFSVTLPNAKYGLISAGFVSFTLAITDFGVPKVIGGSFNVLALDIYKQVIGQQNFQIGSVVSMLLLVPAVLAFYVDRHISKQQAALISSKSKPLVIADNRARDWGVFSLCALISLFIVSVIVICQVAALVKFWPYNLELGLQHYAFNKMDGGGWQAYFNSIVMAFSSACIGTALVFLGAYMVEKFSGSKLMRALLQFLSMMPMAIPGMVLGLAYIFFFNDSNNPLNVIYGTMAILVISTITHLYTVSHLTSVTALKQMDTEFEAVTTSLQQPFWRTLFAVSIPVCLPALVEVWLYIFVNAMTTVSAVVFLYSPDTSLASVAVLNMDDAGDIAPAAAMALMIFYTNVLVRGVHALISRQLFKQQTWR